ncbi:hypothetical protein PHLH8_21020 [Pseudomonas sp. Pc102]|uniref:hypothetical protein n=1 Tax=Pseudomonas sp. Pc102 TaxID=2678261 RepID=UPI001BCB2F54|nr:hypothetical protein [Pseudomonas sp. Pc102]BBP82460.1 hypothetical protein PHLH8_21020 [Pseudomonas sp. Pc102]
MREDQRVRLSELRDELMETALLDADPKLWTAAGKAPADMSQEERGDAYWCRKLAVSTVSLLTKVQGMLETHGKPTAGNGKDEGDLDREIRQAEKEAAAMLERAQSNVH